MTDEQRKEAFKEFLIEQINDRVSLGIYLDEDLPWYNEEQIKIELDEPEEPYPLEISGQTPEKLVCNDYDEHCRYCRKLGCNTFIFVKWRAELINIDGLTLTYNVHM